MERGGDVAQAGARVPKMAIRCFWVTATPESATFLHRTNTSEENIGCLATLAHRRTGR